MRCVKDVLIEVKTLLSPTCEEVEPLLLLSHFTALTSSQILLGVTKLDQATYTTLMAAVQKRLTGYPLQYILGEWEFYGLPMQVGEGVLIPRADTEILVETCIKHAGNRPQKIADLCSGTGCIAIALKKNLPQSNVVAVEKSDKALPYLYKNIKQNNVEVTVVEGDVLNDNTLTGEFDIIVSNPPYLTKTDMEALQKEVQYEPSTALFGISLDGLHFYREIARLYKSKLSKGGLLAFEVGVSQHDQVEQILLDCGYKMVCKDNDLCGIIRVVYTINNVI